MTDSSEGSTEVDADATIYYGQLAHSSAAYSPYGLKTNRMASACGSDHGSDGGQAWLSDPSNERLFVAVFFAAACQYARAEALPIRMQS